MVQAKGHTLLPLRSLLPHPEEEAASCHMASSRNQTDLRSVARELFEGHLA